MTQSMTVHNAMTPKTRARQVAASALAALILGSIALPAHASTPFPAVSLGPMDVAATTADSDETEDPDTADENDSEEDAEDTSANPENAELPDKGDYTCIAPGRHEIALNTQSSYPQLVLNDYTGTNPIARMNFSVVVPVPDAAMRTVSESDTQAGFDAIAPAGTRVWTLPQTPNTQLAQISLNTTGWNWAETDPANLRIHFASMTGPAPVSLWTLNDAQKVVLNAKSDNTQIALNLTQGEITPINTSFLAPGYYEADLEYTANLKGRTTNAGFFLYYAVGDNAVRQACGDEFIPAANTDTATPNNPGSDNATENQPTPNTPSAPGSDPNTDNTGEGNGTATPGNTTQPGDTPQSTEATQPGDSAEPGDNPQSTEQPQSGDTPQTGDTPQSAGNGTQKPGTQKPGTQDPTTAGSLIDPNGTEKKRIERRRTARQANNPINAASTMPETCNAVAITRESEPNEADKVHHAQAEQGSARTTLTFNVGDSAQGNANDGHFDLGPIIENNTIYARVKDDRTQPAQWVDPSTFTFALGNSAAIKAPAGMDNIAPAGKTVWMIQQSQRPNVPWLGMNSQHPSVLSETTGNVTFTLESVNGPGKVAVFESGAFGSGIGTIVFDGAGTAYTIGPNTHAHHNWVFTEPGAYTLTVKMNVEGKNGAIKGSGSIAGFTVTGETGPNGRPMIQEIVGRTESGAPCDLSAAGTAGGARGLAKTGAENLHILIIAITAAFLGAYMTTVGKKNA